MAPVRIQLSRAKGWRMPPNTVKVDRATRWGNPYRIGATYHEADFGGDPWSFPLVRDAEHAEGLYQSSTAMADASMFRAHVRAHLAGKNLACWCKLGTPCHADVLLELANGPREGVLDAEPPLNTPEIQHKDEGL